MSMCLKQAIIILALTTMVLGARIQPKLMNWVAGCGTLYTIQMLNRDPTPEEEGVGCLLIKKDISDFLPETHEGLYDKSKALKLWQVNNYQFYVEFASKTKINYTFS